jgi:hypothetical protein
MIISTDL